MSTRTRRRGHRWWETERWHVPMDSMLWLLDEVIAGRAGVVMPDGSVLTTIIQRSRGQAHRP